MPTTKKLVELFQAIGMEEMGRAAAMARSMAKTYGTRGQFQAERQMLNALEFRKTSSQNGHSLSATHSAWSFHAALMPLKVTKRLDEVELSANARDEIALILKEWTAAEKLSARGIPRRWRLLFHGPSGCGKSITAGALATASGLPAFLVRFDSLIGAYLGQTALRLREVFRFAEENPCVLIFDEVDALAKRRGNPMEVGELDRIVIAFMQELEHASAKGFIVATSNLPDALDDALWRRFDLRVVFPKPTETQVVNFARRLSEGYHLALTRKRLSVYRKSLSYAEVEQNVISEVRQLIINEM